MKSLLLLTYCAFSYQSYGQLEKLLEAVAPRQIFAKHGTIEYTTEKYSFRDQNTDALVEALSKYKTFEEYNAKFGNTLNKDKPSTENVYLVYSENGILIRRTEAAENINDLLLKQEGHIKDTVTQTLSNIGGIQTVYDELTNKVTSTDNNPLPYPPPELYAIDPTVADFSKFLVDLPGRSLDVKNENGYLLMSSSYKDEGRAVHYFKFIDDGQSRIKLESSHSVFSGGRPVSTFAYTFYGKPLTMQPQGLEFPSEIISIIVAPIKGELDNISVTKLSVLRWDIKEPADDKLIINIPADAKVSQ